MGLGPRQFESELKSEFPHEEDVIQANILVHSQESPILKTIRLAKLATTKGQAGSGPNPGRHASMTAGRILDIPGVRNFRDMGGHKNKTGRSLGAGRLFRSGHFAEVDEVSARQIAEHNISTVVDFRSGPEKERMKVTWHTPWQPTYIESPIGGNAAAWIQDLFERMSNSAFPAKELREQFILAFQTIPIANADGLKVLFDALVDGQNDGAAVFHCTAGKDRTGIAGALIMSALDMPEDVIFEDFLMTNKAVDLETYAVEVAAKVSERVERDVSPEAVYPLIGVEPDFLKAAFTVMGEKYGSVDGYLTNAMGLSAERRAALQSRLLAD